MRLVVVVVVVTRMVEGFSSFKLIVKWLFLGVNIVLASCERATITTNSSCFIGHTCTRASGSCACSYDLGCP